MTHEEYQALQIADKVSNNTIVKGRLVYYDAGCIFDVCSKHKGLLSVKDALKQDIVEWYPYSSYEVYSIQSESVDVVPRKETALECRHIAGSTPLMGFIICKLCGKDLRPWGM